MKRRQLVSLLGGAALPSFSALPAYAGPADGCDAPLSRDDGWRVAAIDDDKLVDRAALCKMGDRLAASSEANIHAVLVARGGTLVYERYFKGSDEVPDIFSGRRVENVTFDADTLHNVKSVSKSVVSLTVGIALDRDLIRSVDEPIFSFFPELADLRTPEKDRLLLRHALTMTMGLQWVEATPDTGDENNDESRMHRAADPCRYVLGLPTTAPAGQEFFYNTGALTLSRRSSVRPPDAPSTNWREQLCSSLWALPARSGAGSRAIPTQEGDCACDRATWPRSASLSSRAVGGTAARSFQGNGSRRRRHRRSRRSLTDSTGAMDISGGSPATGSTGGKSTALRRRVEVASTFASSRNSISSSW